MNTEKYFKDIVEEIHSVVFATIDENNHPVTCAIDIMDFDDDSLYFLTAKGKSFYNRLKQNQHIALTGIKGNDTLSRVAVSIQGEAREIGLERLALLFKKNPYMENIYPTVQSKTALTVFQIYKGTGEYFDLSKQPIERHSFSFGNSVLKKHGYFINDRCTNCKLCYLKCPQKCIDCSMTPVRIQQEHCLHCGNCYEVCPNRAIERS